MLDFEFAILDFIQNNLRSGFGDFIMPLISALGNGGIIWILFAGVLCIFPKCRKFGIIILISLGLDLLICNLTLKPLIARIRPFNVNTDIKLLISPPKDFSFPSGHTAAAFSAAFALFFGKSKLWIPSIFLAALIAFSRMYLYVHYPSDVFAGALLGLIVGAISNMIYELAQRCFSGDR